MHVLLAVLRDGLHILWASSGEDLYVLPADYVTKLYMCRSRSSHI